MGTGKKFSGEFGEGDIPLLKEIKAATFVYESQQEYNVPLMPPAMSDLVANPMWPFAPSIFKQVGAATKELFVDNLVNEADESCLLAHIWMNKSAAAGLPGLKEYGGG